LKENKGGGLIRSAGSVGFAVFLSRILGLVREQVLAGLFGASTQMDAFVVAFRIPNLLRDLFAEGALSAAFVTVFTEYEQKTSKEETLRLVGSVLTVLTILVSLIVLLGIAFSREIVLLMAPEFSRVAGKVALTTTLTRIMFPFLLAVSTASIFMGILNARGHFFLPSLASAMFNLSSIVIGGGLALLLPRYGIQAIVGMAVGTLLGGIAQAFIQVPPLLKEGVRVRIPRPVIHPGLKKILVLMIPSLIGLSATQINIFINTNFASRCAEGSVAWLNYAFRLILFPIGIFGVAVSIAAMPRLAKKAAEADIKALGETLVSSLSLSMALTVPAAVGLWVMAVPLVRLIFERGQFTPFDTLMTAQALRYYAIGLFAYSAVKIVVPTFYALNDTRWPVFGSFVAVFLNVVIILATLDPLQHRAIALSTSVTMIVNLVLLGAVLYRKTGGYPLKRLIVDLFKIMAASLLMGLTVKGFLGWIHPEEGILLHAFQVFSVIGVGVLVYGLSGLALGVSSLRMVLCKGLVRR